MKYSIKELEELSGISARSIRYYISNDILPPPEGAGRGAYYTPAHLEQLTLIQELMSQRKMTIEQIRSLFNEQTEDTERQQNDDQRLLHRIQTAIGRDIQDLEHLLSLGGLSDTHGPSPENWVRMQLHPDGIEINLKRWIYEAYSHEIRRVLQPLMEEIDRIDQLKDKAFRE